MMLLGSGRTSIHLHCDIPYCVCMQIYQSPDWSRKKKIPGPNYQHKLGEKEDGKKTLNQACVWGCMPGQSNTL